MYKKVCVVMLKPINFNQMKNLTRVLLMAAFCMLLGCHDKEPNNPEPPEPPGSTDPVVMVMKPATVAQCLQSISDVGVMTFKGLPGDETPRVGDIICSGITENAPYGFFYRVAKVTANGGNTVIETSEASLEEAIENADFSKTFNLDEYIIGIDDHEGNPIELSSLKSSQTESVTIAFPFDISVKKAEGAISLKGNVSLENELVFDVSIKGFKMDYMQMVYKMKQEVQTTLGGELEGEAQLLGENGFTIASIHLAPLSFMIGPVPVVISHDILLVMKIDLSGKMEVTIDAKTEASIELGVEYKNNQTKGIQKQTSNTTVEPKVTLSGALTITAEPKYSASFFGLKNFNSVELFAGIAVETKLSQEIAAIADLLKYGLNPEVIISRIIKAGIRAKLKLFSKQIMNVELSVELLNEPLIKGSVFPQFSDVEVTDFGVAVATADTPEGSLLRFIYPVSQYGIILSENPLPAIDNGWYNNLGAIPATWTPATAPTASAFLKDLPGVGEIDDDKTYYICVYFRNVFGTFYSKVTKYPDDDDDNYVVINGVKWATRNVGTPGTFVEKSEDFGGYYQWNRGTTNLLPAKDYILSGYADPFSWGQVRDPSPTGFRVPTLEEMEKLFNETYVEIQDTWVNDVFGIEFTDRATGKSIFLPAGGYFRVGYYDAGQGEFVNSGDYCSYWSATTDRSQSVPDFGYLWDYDIEFVLAKNIRTVIGSEIKFNACSVRSVKD